MPTPKLPQSYIDAYVEYITILARIDKRVKMEKMQKEKEKPAGTTE